MERIRTINWYGIDNISGIESQGEEESEREHETQNVNFIPLQLEDLSPNLDQEQNQVVAVTI